MHDRSISSAPGEVLHAGKKKPERLLVSAMAKNPEPKSVAFLERTPLDDLVSVMPYHKLAAAANACSSVQHGASHLRPSCPITMICIPRPSTLSFSSAANSSESKAVQSAGGCRRLWPWAPCTTRTSSPGLRRRSHARIVGRGSRLVCWIWMQEKLAPSSVARGC